MVNCKENISHQNYTDFMANTRKMILMSEFILENDYEEQFADFLKNLNCDSDEWIEFKIEIKDLIQEFSIEDQDVQEEMKYFIKVKPLTFC